MNAYEYIIGIVSQYFRNLSFIGVTIVLKFVSFLAKQVEQLDNKHQIEQQ
jgi:hypothetical protein